MRFEAIREACTHANLRLPQTGLVDLTFGNVSVYDPDSGVFAIKPSGVSYDALRPADMVILDLEGKIVEGKLRPSSDTPTHRRLYQAFGGAGVRSVVHTHSRNAVSFAQAGREIPCFGTTHCDYFLGPVPVTRDMTEVEVKGEYEWDTAKVIIEAFEGRDPMECPAVLVRNHGPFTWGPSGEKAVETAVALEVIAEMAWKTALIRPDAPQVPSYLLQKHFFRKHGEGAYYGQS